MRVCGVGFLVNVSKSQRTLEKENLLKVKSINSENILIEKAEKTSSYI